jgi:hypothetical protein
MKTIIWQAPSSPAGSEEKIIMRIPQQVSERVKEAPAQALRAVFSGIGQVLLVADRIKSRAAELQRETPPDPGPRAESAARAQSAAHTATAPKEESRWRSLDETGNVRLLPQQDVPAARPEATQPESPEIIPEAAESVAEPAEITPQPADITTETPPEAVGITTEPPSTTPEPAASLSQTSSGGGPSVADTALEPSGSVVRATLPVPNYDELTVASLRARLRNLDSSQVRVLLDYEKANAGRPAVLTMFERRIAKLESGQA